MRLGFIRIEWCRQEDPAPRRMRPPGAAVELHPRRRRDPGRHTELNAFGSLSPEPGAPPGRPTWLDKEIEGRANRVAGEEAVSTAGMANIAMNSGGSLWLIGFPCPVVT
jgi:hypothetical protein